MSTKSNLFTQSEIIPTSSETVYGEFPTLFYFAELTLAWIDIRVGAVESTNTTASQPMFFAGISNSNSAITDDSAYAGFYHDNAISSDIIGIVGTRIYDGGGVTTNDTTDVASDGFFRFVFGASRLSDQCRVYVFDSDMTVIESSQKNTLTWTNGQTMYPWVQYSAAGTGKTCELTMSKFKVLTYNNATVASYKFPWQSLPNGAPYLPSGWTYQEMDVTEF